MPSVGDGAGDGTLGVGDSTPGVAVGGWGVGEGVLSAVGSAVAVAVGEAGVALGVKGVGVGGAVVPLGAGWTVAVRVPRRWTSTPASDSSEDELEQALRSIAAKATAARPSQAPPGNRRPRPRKDRSLSNGRGRSMSLVPDQACPPAESADGPASRSPVLYKVTGGAPS